MREKLMKILKDSDLFFDNELKELETILKWLSSEYISELLKHDDVDELLDAFLSGYHHLEFTDDEDMVEEKRKYRKDYKSFFAKYDELIGEQQSILILYKPISVEYRHYFCFSDGFYIGGVSNLVPIPKSKKKEVIKELLRVLLKNKSFRYKSSSPFEVFYQIKITPEQLLEYCR